MLGKKTKKNNKDAWGKSFDLFKVSDKRATEIINEFKHAKVDLDKWTDVWSRVAKTLKNEREFAYAGFVFGRMYSLELNPLEGLMSAMAHMHDHS